MCCSKVQRVFPVSESHPVFIIQVFKVCYDYLIKYHKWITEYHCGSDQGWSSIYSFRTLPGTTDWSPHFAIFGDLGNTNAQSLPRLQEEAQAGMYDAILHVGDFAYDMDSVIVLLAL